MSPKKSGLGKGLEALFADNAADVATRSLRVADIEPNRDQPRKHFDESALAELADSIRQFGVIQPIAVRPLPGGGYQIIAGERRWRAARMAGLTEVPVVVLELTEAETMEIALVENLQREDLNPMEEAEGYRALADQFGLTQDQIAGKVGRSRPAVANALRLLTLPDKVRALVERGDLSAGHARALLALGDERTIETLAEEAVRKGLTVRELEAIAARQARGGKTPINKLPNAFHREMAVALTEQLARPVKIEQSGKKGRLILEFYSDAELRELAEKLVQ